MTLETIPEDMMKKIVYNSLIRSDGTTYLTDEFPDGALGQVSMADRTVSVSFDTAEDGTREIWINGQSKIIGANNEVHNGVVHVVDAVLEPSEKTPIEVIADHEAFSLWYEAFLATGIYHRDGGHVRRVVCEPLRGRCVVLQLSGLACRSSVPTS